ncbi:snare protein syntaxin-like protein 18/UFE1 [Apiospora kogelbergensis]|uniref:snare protein syntaxin-like protein 18/UFE1 n=1 Tax=Apiospora kogelbergensis TaxID=1337665 RepID=UPI00312DFC74
MTDLTPLFDSFLSQHKASPTKRAFSVDNLDEFLKEAYKINQAITSLHTDLRSIRHMTDSPAPLTDREREEIDANSKSMLRQLNAKIRELSEAENARREMEAGLIAKKFGRGLGALGAWAAGGGKVSKTAEHATAEDKANMLNTHRESVLWTLQQRLQECVKTQQGMMEVRLHREMEKNRSVLAKATGSSMASLGVMPEAGSPVRERRKQSQSLPPDQQPSYSTAQDLSPEQIQMFEQENHDMLKHYESTLDQVRTAEKSLIEISELQTQLVNNLATQSAHIDQLVTDSFNTAENVGRGNTQLKKATEKPSMAKYMFYTTCGLCSFLVVWDLII